MNTCNPQLRQAWVEALRKFLSQGCVDIAILVDLHLIVHGVVDNARTDIRHPRRRKQTEHKP